MSMIVFLVLYMIDDVADCLQGIFNDHKCGKLFISVADTICKIDFKYQINITNFWSIVLDDHWSKKIYRPKMIVDVRCYIHLSWSCFKNDLFLSIKCVQYHLTAFSKNIGCVSQETQILHFQSFIFQALWTHKFLHFAFCILGLRDPNDVCFLNDIVFKQI